MAVPCARSWFRSCRKYAETRQYRKSGPEVRQWSHTLSQAVLGRQSLMRECSSGQEREA